jgi:hypothetical protein
MRFGRNEKLMPLIKSSDFISGFSVGQNAAHGGILSVSIKCRTGTLSRFTAQAGARFPASQEAFLCHGLP